MKRIISMLLAVGMVVSIMAGCGNKSKSVSSSDVDTHKENAAYMDLVGKIESGFANNWSNELPETLELSNIYSYGYVDNFGYAIKDINNDGVNELLIGTSEGDAKNPPILFDIFTFAEHQFIKLATGGERDRYYLCENGFVAEEGSGSAFNSFYAYYELKDYALKLHEAVIYDSNENEKNPWFYSTSDITAQSGESITEQRADEIQKQYKYQNVELTSFKNQPKA